MAEERWLRGVGIPLKPIRPCIPSETMSLRPEELQLCQVLPPLLLPTMAMASSLQHNREESVSFSSSWCH